jgi:hypothetical protein
VLVPSRHILVSVCGIQQPIFDQHLNLKRGSDGGGRCLGLEEFGRVSRGLQDSVVDGVCACEELLGVGCSAPRAIPEAIRQPEIGLVSNLERIELHVLHAVHGSLGGRDNAVEVVRVVVGHVQSERDGRVLGEAIKGLEIGGPDDVAICGIFPLRGGFWVALGGIICHGRIVEDIVLCVPSQADVRRCARIVGEVLQQAYGKGVRFVLAREGEEIRRLDAKAGKRGIEDRGDESVGGLGGGRECDGQGAVLSEGKGREG